MNEKMTAVDYLMAKKRMHQTIKKCDNCPINSVVDGENMCAYLELIDPEEIVGIVSKWAKEHPEKTRQSEFLKLYPNAAINDGAINLCPRDINTKIDCKYVNERTTCTTCRKNYWLTEVE